MKKLTSSQFVKVSIMLFGLFFGAGNLIFPPLLGNQAGSSLWIALFAFAITAVVFPVLGAIAVGKTEGLSNLANRVSPVFSIVFTTAIYISIGPGLGIPRAGSVPFEMAVAQYIPESFNLFAARIIYTAVFFLIALWICLKPNKLVERVGKYLTPALLLLILFMFVRLLSLPAQVAQPVGEYATSPVTEGFLKGYDTMDAVAALNFGFVISLAIKRFGIKDKKEVTNYTVKAGIFAGSLLLVVYAMLSYIGKMSSATMVGAPNGAVILTESVKLAFGDFGAVLLAAIFTLACLTTCVGLITSGGEYFHTLFKEKLSYRSWVIIWTGFSFVVANFGLNNLLKFSVPLLTVIYPVALVLIVLGVTDDYVNYPKMAYQAAAVVSVGLPFVAMLKSFEIELPLLTALEKGLPFADKGLSWVLPTVVLVVSLTLLDKAFARQKSKASLSDI